MTALAVLAAMLAILLWLPRRSDPLRRLRPLPPPNRGRRWAWWVIPLIAAPIAVWAALGATPGVLAVTGIIIGWTMVHLVLAWQRMRRADRVSVEVASACSVLAGQCRVGQVPAEALRAAVVDHPVLAQASAVHDMGGDVTQLWRRQASRPGQHGLLALSRAWQVSSEVGAPMADALDQVARTLAADRRVRTVITGELAAPRATSRLLGALPIFGIVLGLALGGDPVSFLLQHPVGQGCLVGGVILACTGLLWVERLANRGGAGAR